MSNHTSPSYLLSVLRQGAAPLSPSHVGPSPPAAESAPDPLDSAAPSTPTHAHPPEAPGIPQRPGDTHAGPAGGADAGRARTSDDFSDAPLSSPANATHETGGAYDEAGAEEGAGASAASGRRAPSDVLSPLMRAARGYGQAGAGAHGRSARAAAGTAPPPEGVEEHEAAAVQNLSGGGHEALAPGSSGAGEARGGVSVAALNTWGAAPTLKGDASTSTVTAPTFKSGEGSGFTSKITGTQPGSAGTADGGGGGEEARLIVVRRGQADAWAEEAALARAVSAEAVGPVGPAPRIEFEDLGRVRPFREESWERAVAGRRALPEAAADVPRAASPEGGDARPPAHEAVAEAAALTLRARDEARAREDVSVIPQAPGRDGVGPRGALARGPFPPPREESPRLVINRLDVQVVNQPPAQAPAPARPAPAEPSQADDSWDGLERHHLGHVRLML